MKKVIIAWVIKSVLIPFAFWLDDANHRHSDVVLSELKEAKREGLTLYQYRRKHRPV